MTFMDDLEKEVPSTTENGAKGYKYTGNPLLDIAYKVPTLRREAASENLYEKYFKDAYEFDPNHALKWLLYLRDIRGGLGERYSFRNIITNMSNDYFGSKDIEVDKLVSYCDLEEYGRWDDLIELYMNSNSDRVKDTIIEIISNKLDEDLGNMDAEQPCSLLAKWMPSINASSKETRKKAKVLAKDLHLSYAQYRICLSSLRKYLNVIETKMSNNEWNKIDYNSVPSKANIIYKDAFLYHDKKRREQYIEDLKNGDAKINSSANMPYDIVNKYFIQNNSIYYGYYDKANMDDILEELWKNLPEYFTNKDILPVVDTSGSMMDRIGSKGNVPALAVSVAMGIYCAQHIKSEQFKNRFITFSNDPDIVRIDNKSLLNSIESVMNKKNVGFNTNVKAVFDLVLKTAVNNKLKQEDLPESILFISDMEFDEARRDGYCYYGKDEDEMKEEDNALMKIISDKYKSKGYKLPKLIFWNVNSRTDTIPVTKNDNGLILVSGFSTSIFKMVCSDELDPFKALCKELDTDRYSIIDEVF